MNKTEYSKPKGFAKKFENFMYHYKWHSIFAIVGLAIAILFIHDFATRVNYDLYVIIAGDVYVDEQSYNVLTEKFNSMASDINGDGEVKVGLMPIYLPEEAGSEADMASQMKLMAELSSDTTMVFIFDDKRYQDLFSTEEFLQNICTEGDRYSLKDSELLSGTNLENKKELYIGLRSKDKLKLNKDKIRLEYEESLKIVKNILGDNFIEN